MENQKDFNAEFTKQLKKTAFPKEQVIDAVIEHSFAMFNAKSLHELNIDAGDYNEVLLAISNDELSLYEMSHILNNLPGMSPKDLGITINEYTALMLQVEEMGKRWKEIMKPIQQKLMNEMNRIAAEEEAKAAKQNGKNVNPNLRRS